MFACLSNSDAYWRTASKNMDSGSASLPFHNSVEFESKEDDHIPAEDLWMVEMQYKVSVSLQRSTWEKRGPEIVRLASSSKDEEGTGIEPIKLKYGQYGCKN